MIVCGALTLALYKPFYTIKPMLDIVFDAKGADSDNLLNLVDSDYSLEDRHKAERVVVDDDTKQEHTMLYPYYGDKYATLNCIPAGMNDIPVYCGTDSANLEKGAAWFNGSVYYTFFFGLSLAALALALRTAQAGGWGRILGLCLLAAFLGGGNLVTGLSLAIMSVSGVALLLLFGKKQQALRLLVPALVMLGCFIVNIAAPGNAIRALSVDHEPNAVQAILLSFREAIVLGVRWTRLPVIAAMALLGYLFYQAVPASSFRFRFPGLVSLYSYCLYSAMFCPTMYAMGSRGDWRLVDIIFYAYLLLLGLNVLYWVGWLRQRREGAAAAQPKLLPVLGCLALCLVCLAVSAKIHGGISLASAYTALSSGQAATYAREDQARLKILHDPEIRIAELPAYSDPPYLLFFDDIGPDPEDWRNVGVQTFYEKDRVYLEGSR